MRKEPTSSRSSPDGLERGCARIWDRIEALLVRREALLVRDGRSAEEEEELAAIWPEIETLRAYSAYYRELLRREANTRAGLRPLPRLLEPRR